MEDWKSGNVVMEQWLICKKTASVGCTSLSFPSQSLSFPVLPFPSPPSPLPILLLYPLIFPFFLFPSFSVRYNQLGSLVSAISCVSDHQVNYHFSPPVVPQSTATCDKVLIVWLQAITTPVIHTHTQVSNSHFHVHRISLLHGRLQMSERYFYRQDTSIPTNN